jgi:orotate phosphoribosyltransferase
MMTTQVLERIGAILHGHFLLTSGRHSAVYFEKFRLLERPDLLAEAVSAMLESFPSVPIEGVVGPTLGGVIVAYEVARQLGCGRSMPSARASSAFFDAMAHRRRACAC